MTHDLTRRDFLKVSGLAATLTALAACRPYVEENSSYQHRLVRSLLPPHKSLMTKSYCADSLAAFYKDLGDKVNKVTVETMSEFGRRLEENGNGGTDHGHGGVMFLMGKNINGGKVYGDWPGL